MAWISFIIKFLCIIIVIYILSSFFQFLSSLHCFWVIIGASAHRPLRFAIRTGVRLTFWFIWLEFICGSLALTVFAWFLRWLIISTKIFLFIESFLRLLLELTGLIILIWKFQNTFITIDRCRAAYIASQQCRWVTGGNWLLHGIILWWTIVSIFTFLKNEGFRSRIPFLIAVLVCSSGWILQFYIACKWTIFLRQLSSSVVVIRRPRLPRRPVDLLWSVTLKKELIAA